jgi:hypothetical protein
MLLSPRQQHEIKSFHPLVSTRRFNVGTLFVCVAGTVKRPQYYKGKIRLRAELDTLTLGQVCLARMYHRVP